MGLKKWAILALIVLMALSQATPAAAWAAAKMGGVIGDVFLGSEWALQKPSATLFHSQTAAATDTEAFALAFPTGESLVSTVPGIGSTTAFNLGLPTIAQTSSASGVATDTGFFRANYGYTRFGNAGGYDLAHDISAWHPVKTPYMAGSGISWPYMNNAPVYGESLPATTFRPAINTSSEKATQPMSFTGTSNASKPVNATAASNATKKATPPRDYKNMTKEDVMGMSALEKMYRNTELVNTVPLSYKGTVDNPTVIAPLARPIDIIKPSDKPKVIADALDMTTAGTHLKTKFWDL